MNLYKDKFDAVRRNPYSSYSLMNDSELDRIVKEITVLSPQCGEKSVNGCLQSGGIHIQRERIRASLRRVDPSGVLSRCRSVLHYCVYCVPSANALWHIDGYHKLIHWRIVVHRGIDRFSRLIMYLKAATNNRADTVLNAFLGAAEKYGLQSEWTEVEKTLKLLISYYSIQNVAHNGTVQSLVAASTHNQRIECLWRDLFSGCISFFYYFFTIWTNYSL